jgi:hypothetical protein
MSTIEVVAMAGLLEMVIGLWAAVRGMRRPGEPRWTRLDWWALGFGLLALAAVRILL